MKHQKIKKQDENITESGLEALEWKPFLVATTNSGGTMINRLNFRKCFVIVALTVLTSSQAIFIVWSKSAGNYEYGVTTANFSAEALMCALSLLALLKIWKRDGITVDNKLGTSFIEVIIYSIPATIHFAHNLLQDSMFANRDGRNHPTLKIFDIFSTGVLSHLILKRKLTVIQWIAFLLLCVGCSFAQPHTLPDRTLRTTLQGWVMAIVMKLLSVFVGVSMEAIIKKHPSKNIYVCNFWFSILGVFFELVTLINRDIFDVIPMDFHGYSFFTVCMILNHALCGIAVLMVLKYTDNIVKVYSTSVAMLLATIVSKFLFGSLLSNNFLMGVWIVSASVLLHGAGSLSE